MGRTETYIAGWHSTTPLSLSIDSARFGNILNLDTANLGLTTKLSVNDGGIVNTHNVEMFNQQLVPLSVGVVTGNVALSSADWADFVGGLLDMIFPIDGDLTHRMRVYLPDTMPTATDLYIAEDGSLYDDEVMEESSFISGRALTVEEFYGKDLRVGSAITVSQVIGYTYRQVIETLNKQLTPLVAVQTDELYQVIIGKNADDFTANRATATVVQEFIPQIAVPGAQLVTTHDPDVAVQLSTKLCADDFKYNDILILINGVIAYQGRANATEYAPAIVGALPTEGYIALVASQENEDTLTILPDRLTLTFDTGAVTVALPKGHKMAAGEIWYFDRHGNCYNDFAMNATSFLAGFLIEDSAGFDEGAVANELELLDEYSRKICTEFLLQKADGYELDALGRKWFGIPRRVGETDDNYIRRLVAAVTGLAATRYSLEYVLRMFSPRYVKIQEGLKNGVGYFGASFFNNDTAFPEPFGVFTNYVTSAHFAQNAGGSLYIVITIEKTAITDDPVNAKFIYDLVSKTVAAGVGFIIYKVEL